MATRSEKISMLQEALTIEFNRYFEGLSYDLEVLHTAVGLLANAMSEIATCDRCGKTALELSDYNSFNSQALCNECYALVAGKWLCIWGQGYQILKGQADMKEVDSSYFTANNGYNCDDYQVVLQLQIGEAYTCNESGAHTIVRIK
jgi:hypothetical protein